MFHELKLSVFLPLALGARFEHIFGHVVLDVLTTLKYGPKYLKNPLRAISFSSTSIVSLVMSFVLKLHFMYVVLLWFNLNLVSPTIVSIFLT